MSIGSTGSARCMEKATLLGGVDCLHMAASLITTAIVLALFMTVQHHLTRGLLGGDVK